LNPRSPDYESDALTTLLLRLYSFFWHSWHTGCLSTKVPFIFPRKVSSILFPHLEHFINVIEKKGINIVFYLFFAISHSYNIIICNFLLSSSSFFSYFYIQDYSSESCIFWKRCFSCCL
jgi:hypothetical protein